MSHKNPTQVPTPMTADDIDDLWFEGLDPALSLSHLKPGGSYYGDGFEIPSLKSVYKKMEFKTSSLTLLSSNKDMLDPHSTDKASLGQLLAGSTKMLKEAVGNIHRVWITNDIFISAMTELTTALEATQVLATNFHPELFIGLIQILAEIYEVPLGGYDEAAYIVFYQHLFNEDVALNAATIEGIQNINGEGEVVNMSLDTLSGIMTAAGMNGLTQYAVTGDQVVNIPAAVTKAVELSQYANSGLGINLEILRLYPLSWNEIVTKLGMFKAIEFFLFVTTYIGVALSKGLLNPALVKTGTAAVVVDNDYDSDYGDEEADVPHIPVDKQALELYRKAVVGLGLSQEFLDNSVMFSGIEYYINTVEAAMNEKAVTINTAFFCKEKVEVAVDEAAVRAGVSMSFVGLNSPLQEVEAPKVVVKAEAPALTAQEIAALKQSVYDSCELQEETGATATAIVTAIVTKAITTTSEVNNVSTDDVENNDPDGLFVLFNK